MVFFFFFSSRRRHTRWTGDWSSDVCSSDLGDALAFVDAQTGWFRHFAGPGVGAWDGIVAGFQGARQLVSGPGDQVVFPGASDPFQEATLNLMLLGFLGFAIVTSAGVVR